MKAHISVLGSTGSIGRQTLDVAQKEGYPVIALAAGQDEAGLEAQIRQFHPRAACLTNEAAAAALRIKVADTDTRIYAGMSGLRDMIREEAAQIYAISMAGMIALEPVLWAIETGARIALSNKESIVTAGHIMMPAVRQYGAELIPVDSEHSAIFQCLQGERDNPLARIWLTASGGPFRGYDAARLARVMPAQALKHPNWSMGHKITVDSASLANKGLEVMEAHHLFGASYDQIQVVIHPESLIHSMVEFADGAVKAQLGAPDMRLPIEYALGYPKRGGAIGEPLDFWKLGTVHFEAPDTEHFPALALAYEAGRKGGSMPTVFNAADEWAVAAFLRGEISFPAIAAAIGEAMARHSLRPDPSLEEILAVRAETEGFLNAKASF